MATPIRKTSKRFPAPSKLPARPVLTPADPSARRLADLGRQLARKQPRRPAQTCSLLKDTLEPWYEKNVERPGRELQKVATLWMELVPKRLLDHTQLVSLKRTILCVAVPNSTMRSELDMLLRRGLQRQLQTLSRGAVYRVKTATDASSCEQ